MASGINISQAMDETTLRRSPRRRSPAKQADFNTAMDGVVPRSKSPSRKSLERTSRSRSPIRKSPKKATSDISRLGLFGAYQTESDKDFISNNSSGAISTDDLNAGYEPLDEMDPKSILSSPQRPANWMQLTETFPQSNVQRDGLGLFGQPSSPISYWPPSTSPKQSPSTPQKIGLFGQPINPRSPPIAFNASPFQPRSHFGHSNSMSTTRGLFGNPLPQRTKTLILPSFIDPLDSDIASWNPSLQVRPPSPPPGILNMPHNASGEKELPDAMDPRYDTDWEEHLFDPVPGAGVYLEELRDPDEKPKNWNVVYARLGTDGEVEIRAMGWNRTGERVKLTRDGELGFQEIEFRSCFGDTWVGESDIEVVKRCAKARLERKIKLDFVREKRFEEDVRRFWRNKIGWRGRPYIQ